ncbi:hypothetical protein ABBQ38_010943 [Trebouxia sp. C0009 RCD-2024]
MEAAVAAELHRLTGHSEVQGQDAEMSSDEAEAAEELEFRGSESEDASTSSGESAADEDDEFADEEAHTPASQLTTVPKPETTDASGTGADPTSSGRPSNDEDAQQDGKQPNTKDLKATGVARAAARLLEQDVAEGGLAILSKSKSVAKRQREEAEETKADKAAKKMRLEMKQRGHVAVPKRGEEPQHDALEKALLRTATRGVVRLFNAVSKAQRDQKDALVGGSRSRAPKLDKASFLAELRGMGHTKGSAKGSAPALPGTGPATAGRPAEPQAQGAPGWGVLSDSFGLQGGAKMKDWDKQDDSSDELPNEDLQDVTDSDTDGGE